MSAICPGWNMMEGAGLQSVMMITSEATILGMLPNVCHYIVKPLFIVGSLTFTMFYDHHVLKHINVAKS